MNVKGMQIRCKKLEFINDFRNLKFKIKPQISFNVGKLNEHVYGVMCEVKIESDSENYMPIRTSILVEGLFEFDDNTSDVEINEYLRKSGSETVYAYTRSILASMTAIAGIQSINLPIIDFNQKMENNNMS